MQIPEDILKRMAAQASPEAQRAEGILIAREALEEFKTSVQGTYIMPPFNRAETVLAVLEGLIERRTAK